MQAASCITLARNVIRRPVLARPRTRVSVGDAASAVACTVPAIHATSSSVGAARPASIWPRDSAARRRLRKEAGQGSQSLRWAQRSRPGARLSPLRWPPEVRGADGEPEKGVLESDGALGVLQAAPNVSKGPAFAKPRLGRICRLSQRRGGSGMQAVRAPRMEKQGRTA